MTAAIARHTPRVVLVTGGAGFIGTSFVTGLLDAEPSTRVVVLDALTYAAGPTIPALAHERLRFVHGDILDEALVAGIFERDRPDTVVHFAAETHVDRSIETPGAFVRTNVLGTYTLLEAARRAWAGRDRGVRFHHVSTDEVFGPRPPGDPAGEHSPYAPSSPYAASKAAADHLVRAYHRTYGLSITCSYSSNNYGPHQFPEKLVPLMILRAVRGQTLPIYGDGGNERSWLYVVDHCEAIRRILRFADDGAAYIVPGSSACSNLELVQRLCGVLDELVPRSRGHRELITFVGDRPGHDRWYAVDGSRLERDLGWVPSTSLDAGLRQTVRWYLDHPSWVRAALRGARALERLGELP